MIGNFDEMQKASKDSMDVAAKSMGAFTKGFQAIAAETADFSKRSFETGAKAMEGLLGAGSLDKAVEVQTDYLKSAYEGYVSQATKVGEIMSGMAREAYKPYESVFGKIAK